MGIRNRRHVALVGLAFGGLVSGGLVAPRALAHATTGPNTCVETPRPDAGLPAFEFQRQAFGFHDEELVLCSPGAPHGGQPTHLATRLWVPASCLPAGGCPGVVVVHGFGGTKETAVADMRSLVTRGMYVLAYDVRGQGQSGGQADMMGRDTIADEAYVLGWFHNQVRPTKTGVYGISQGGTHAFMAAVYNCGPARAASFDSTIPCDAGGTRWVDAIAPAQAPTRLESIDDGTCTQFFLTAAAESRAHPDLVADATRCLFDGTPPDAVVEGVDGLISDGGLARDNDVRNYLTRAGRIDVPVYMATSYFDRLVPATNTTDLYSMLRARAADLSDPYFGTDVRMILSNDAHGDIGANFAVLDDMFTWLERQLKSDATSLRDAPVASAQEWDANSFRLEHDWPIAGSAVATSYLGLDGGVPRLAASVPATSTSELANQPVVSTAPWVPVVGSPVPVQTVGLLQDDSVRYESQPYTTLTEITGLPQLHLWLSTPDGNAFGQVTVALEEVAPDGTAKQFARMRRGFSDLSAVAADKAFPLTMSSWRIDPGNRLRLTITPTDIFEATPALANHGLVIHHGSDAPSRVELPVVDPNRVPPAGAPPSGTSFAEDPLATICAGLGIPCP